ncbi:DUF6350 family protein [Nocardioides sp.]|uniref:cell division protein PerM n=1 Tax=Nocardioides sp. TaxID=35761 RepID=UPI00351688E4
MTSLHTPPVRRQGARPDDEVRRDLATGRPLVLTATLGGALAAGGTLVVLLALGVVGWFLTDAGAVGAPSDSLRVGAHLWLMTHGSGATVEGVRLGVVPLGLTWVCVWTTWRLGHRVGESVSGHGPDATGIADGQRDWTVPLATALFTVGYAVVAVIAQATAATPASAPSAARAVATTVVLGLLVAGPAIARGSGRAAIWVPLLPSPARDALLVARRLLLGWAAISLLLVLVSLALDLSTAANVVSQLHADAGVTVLLILGSLALLPNAALFSSAYLLGPGFTVGAGTSVTTSAVVLGPLPLFPLLAALPDQGAAPWWAAWLGLVPVLLAALAAAGVQRARPVLAWDRAAIRGCAGGLLAAVALGLLTALAGGAVGPGRLAEVGPAAGAVTLHAIAAFGIGGALGALVVCGWQRGGRERLRGLVGLAER